MTQNQYSVWVVRHVFPDQKNRPNYTIPYPRRIFGFYAETYEDAKDIIINHAEKLSGTMFYLLPETDTFEIEKTDVSYHENQHRYVCMDYAFFPTRTYRSRGKKL